MSSLRSILRGWAPDFLVTWVRRQRTKSNIKALSLLPSLTLSGLEEFFKSGLNIAEGDSLFVHASFSDLKVEGAPEDVVNLLVKLVGPQGNILMPFYPIKSSHAALLEGKPFDLRKNRTSMGALVTAFVKRPEVRKSIHPTKSVAVYGRDREHLISDHSKSPMPYGPSSPYFRVTELPRSKIMGLGVTSDFLSCMHVAVDMDENYPIQPYHPKPLEGTVITYEGVSVLVKTYAHDLDITNREDVPRFLNETHCPSYKELVFRGRTFFTVDAKSLVTHVAVQAKEGETFFYPKSLQGRQPKRQS